MEEPDALVTVIDTDRLGQVSEEIERTDLRDRLGLGLWRVAEVAYYHNVREAARRGVAGAQAIYDDLAERFPAAAVASPLRLRCRSLDLAGKIVL